jgi:hypothetical protein
MENNQDSKNLIPSIEDKFISSTQSNISTILNTGNSAKSSVQNFLDKTNLSGAINASGLIQNTKSTSQRLAENTKNKASALLSNSKRQASAIADSAKRQIMKDAKRIEMEFDKEIQVYSKLIRDLFFDLLQLSITLLLFVSIINLTKMDAEMLYPTDLKHEYYGEGKCDLGNLKAGDTTFCGPYSVKTDGLPLSEQKIVGKSTFAAKVQGYATNGGSVTSDTFTIFLLWSSYLLFSCEHFVQTMLQYLHKMAQLLTNAHFVLQFFVIVVIISAINALNVNTITPFLTKLLNIFGNKKDVGHEIANDLIISITSIFALLFIYLIGPLTFYYIFALFKLLTENLSIQLNLICVFAIFLSVKSGLLLLQYLQSNFLKKGKKDKGALMNELMSFISSYILTFIIPLIVAFIALFKLTMSMVLNMNPLLIESKYKYIFFTVILGSFYYPIKKNLDRGFPYSIIYAVLSSVIVAYTGYKNYEKYTRP